ncbi:hypothetical protein TorRG33x02_097790, partial [Trema orientale]
NAATRAWIDQCASHQLKLRLRPGRLSRLVTKHFLPNRCRQAIGTPHYRHIWSPLVVDDIIHPLFELKSALARIWHF